jgi:SAM-dependent methyltransferase
VPYDSDFVARLYDGDYAVLRDPSGDVEFYVDQARRSGGPVLELACGTGRILLATARAGIEITGVDASAAMLARARERLAAEPPEIRRRVVLHEADMCAFDAGRRFPLVTIPFRPVSHLLGLEQQLALVRTVRRHLGPRGRLVFDVFQPDPVFLAGPREERLDLEREEGGRRIRRFSRARPHLATQVMDVTFRWEIEEPSGKRTEHGVEFPMRWYHRYELEHLLARGGLRVLALYGDFRRGPFTDDTWEMIFVAEPASPAE